jgi:hypothetical protein
MLWKMWCQKFDIIIDVPPGMQLRSYIGADGDLKDTQQAPRLVLICSPSNSVFQCPRHRNTRLVVVLISLQSSQNLTLHTQTT